MSENPRPAESWWRALLASKALAQDLIFFGIGLLTLCVMYGAVDRLILTDQDRDTLYALHYRLTLSALALMGAKMLLHLVQSPDGEPDEE